MPRKGYEIYDSYDELQCGTIDDKHYAFAEDGGDRYLMLHARWTGTAIKL